MSMIGLEQVVLDDWLMVRLIADASLAAIIGDRVFQGVAPPSAIYPLVVFQLQSPQDVRGIGTARIITNLTYIVKVLVEASYWTANQRAAVNRIDALLHGVINQAVAGGSVLSGMRTEPYSLVEPFEGKQVRHLGGTYAFQVQAA